MIENFKTNVEIEIEYDSVKPEGLDYESRTSHGRVNYQFILELREWGIKTLSFLVPSQEISLDLELLKDEDEDYEEYSFKVKLTEIDVEGPEEVGAGDICPHTLNLTLTEIVKTGERSFEAKATGTLHFN